MRVGGLLIKLEDSCLIHYFKVSWTTILLLNFGKEGWLVTTTPLLLVGSTTSRRGVVVLLFI